MEDYLIEFNQLAMANSEGSESMLNRVMLRDNIGIAVLLVMNPPNNSHMRSQHILVANAHIHWDPEYADVKLIQTVMLMNELDSIVMKAQGERGIGFKTAVPGAPGIPVVMCGDLNSLPDSSVIKFLMNGKIPTDHVDLHNRGYDGFLSRFATSVHSPHGKPELVHQFNLQHVYNKKQMLCSNYTPNFKGMIDYIFYSSDFLTTTGVLGPVSMDWMKQFKIMGCPNPHFPSDHFSLLCEFMLKPSQ